MKRWTVKRYVVEIYEVWAETHNAAVDDFGESAYGATEIKVLKVTARQVKTEGKRVAEALARVSSDVTCPQCGNPSVKYPSGDSEYCEDCGWPDEDFGEEEK